jgi:hypothetical protein
MSVGLAARRPAETVLPALPEAWLNYTVPGGVPVEVTGLHWDGRVPDTRQIACAPRYQSYYSSDSTSGITLAARVYLESYPATYPRVVIGNVEVRAAGDPDLFALGVMPSGALVLYTGTEMLIYSTYDGRHTALASTAIVPLATWVHVAVTFHIAKNTAFFFIDGILAHTVRTVASDVPRSMYRGSGSTSAFCVGTVAAPTADARTADNTWHGHIIDAAFWDRAMSHADVARVVTYPIEPVFAYVPAIINPVPFSPTMNSIVTIRGTGFCDESHPDGGYSYLQVRWRLARFFYFFLLL